MDAVADAVRDSLVSTKKNFTAGGGFLADDRHKYLGEVDPASGTPMVNLSPGPMYQPSYDYARKRAPSVNFGGRGPGTIRRPPSLKVETPGPGAEASSRDVRPVLPVPPPLRTSPRLPSRADRTAPGLQASAASGKRRKKCVL